MSTFSITLPSGASWTPTFVKSIDEVRCSTSPPPESPGRCSTHDRLRSCPSMVGMRQRASVERIW